MQSSSWTLIKSLLPETGGIYSRYYHSSCNIDASIFFSYLHCLFSLYALGHSVTNCASVVIVIFSLQTPSISPLPFYSTFSDVQMLARELDPRVSVVIHHSQPQDILNTVYQIVPLRNTSRSNLPVKQANSLANQDKLARATEGCNQTTVAKQLLRIRVGHFEAHENLNHLVATLLLLVPSESARMAQ